MTTKSKRIIFYATQDDQAAIAEIQKLKPHWKNQQLVLREGLYELLHVLRATAPQQPFPEFRYLKEE